MRNTLSKYLYLRYSLTFSDLGESVKTQLAFTLVTLFWVSDYAGLTRLRYTDRSRLYTFMHTESQTFSEALHCRHEFIDDFSVAVIAVISQWQHALTLCLCMCLAPTGCSWRPVNFEWMGIHDRKTFKKKISHENAVFLLSHSILLSISVRKTDFSKEEIGKGRDDM